MFEQILSGNFASQDKLTRHTELINIYIIIYFESDSSGVVIANRKLK